MQPEPPNVRAARKDDHVQLAGEQLDQDAARRDFDDIEFLHHALGAIDESLVDLSVEVDSWRWPVPIYINGMTGGTEQTEIINRELAIAARETGLPMACGSMSIAIDAPDDAVIQHSFSVIREQNPNGFVLANIGVGRPASDAIRAVELLQADALQVHLNPVQETVMPEGSRDFSNWQRSLEQIIAASPVPVVVKEVGFGLSRRTLERLTELGATLADVSGTGGTDFLQIENARRTTAQGDYSMLTGFGQSAMACLLDAPSNSPQLLASGGVRNPFDVVKALAVGARAVGVAGSFLRVVRAGGSEALVPEIERWLRQTKSILALLGAASPGSLTSTDILVRGSLAEYCLLRGIDTPALARRSSSQPRKMQTKPPADPTFDTDEHRSQMP